MKFCQMVILSQRLMSIKISYNDICRINRKKRFRANKVCIRCCDHYVSGRDNGVELNFILLRKIYGNSKILYTKKDLKRSLMKTVEQLLDSSLQLSLCNNYFFFFAPATGAFSFLFAKCVCFEFAPFVTTEEILGV
jgi:hypothetical protein